MFVFSALTPTAVQLACVFVPANALAPTAVQSTPVFAYNALTPIAVQLVPWFDCAANTPTAVQLAPVFAYNAFSPTAVQLAPEFPDAALDPTAVQDAAVLDKSALAPTAVQVAVPRVPMIIPLMNESFAMPAPPATMSAPVVDDVDAVVSVTTIAFVSVKNKVSVPFCCFTPTKLPVVVS
jgi:hypothetical protein